MLTHEAADGIGLFLLEFVVCTLLGLPDDFSQSLGRGDVASINQLHHCNSLGEKGVIILAVGVYYPSKLFNL